MIDPKKTPERPKRRIPDRLRYAAATGALIINNVGVSLTTLNATSVVERFIPVAAVSKELSDDILQTSKLELQAGQTYNVVPAGDSLMAGLGGSSHKIDGKQVPDSCVRPFVDILNDRQEGIANYDFRPNFVRPGMPLSELIDVLEKNKTQLADTPNLILVVSAEFQNLQKAAMTAQKETDRSIPALANTAYNTIISYDREIDRFEAAVMGIKQEREAKLDSNQAQMSVVYYGLPDTIKLPSVQERLQKEEVDANVIEPIQFVYNLASKRGVNEAGRHGRNNGIQYAYVELYRKEFDPKIDISDDKFHPSDRGYEKMAWAAAAQVAIIGRNGQVVQ